MIFYSILYSKFILSVLILSLKSDKIYKNCYEGVSLNNFTDDNYLIQPSIESNISKIHCKVFNNSYGLAIIDNDSENLSEEITDPTIFFHNHLERVVHYENFTELDLTLFLESVGMCSQGMKIISFRAHGGAQEFIFWDGSKFSSNNALKDGICKCFIKSVCELSNDSNVDCNINENGWENSLTDEGYFSIKSERLPIHKLHLRDLDREWIKYQIWKLHCYFPLYKINLNKHPENCLLKNLNYLYDLRENTCIETKFSFLSLKLTFDFIQNKLRIITKNEFNCKSNIIGYTYKQGIYMICQIDENCYISCEKSKIIYLEIFKEISQNFISICEIYGVG